MIDPTLSAERIIGSKRQQFQLGFGLHKFTIVFFASVVAVGLYNVYFRIPKGEL